MWRKIWKQWYFSFISLVQISLTNGHMAWLWSGWDTLPNCPVYHEETLLNLQVASSNILLTHSCVHTLSRNEAVKKYDFAKGDNAMDRDFFLKVRQKNSIQYWWLLLSLQRPVEQCELTHSHSRTFYFSYNIRGTHLFLTKEAAQVLVQAFLISSRDYNALLTGMPACAIQSLQHILARFQPSSPTLHRSSIPCTGCQ